MKKDLFQSPIKVWYRPHLKFPKVLWPIVDIKLTYQKRIFPQLLRALVDSGASISVLHPIVAESLGFNLKDLGSSKRGLSASGTYESWALPDLVDVAIYGYTFRFQFTVIDNPNLIWPCIFGGDSIFQIARIDFQKFKGYFEIRFRGDIH